MTREKILRYGFALFSLISSFLFLFYAINIHFSAAPSDWLKTFAYVVGGYGLFNCYILSWAWRTQVTWAPRADMLVAACFFAVVAMDLLRDGISNLPAEGGTLLGLAAVLSINWYAVKLLCQRQP